MESVDDLLKRWERHRNVLQEVLEKIDDEYLHFSPWDGGMPLSALVIHITMSSDLFLAKVQNKPFTSSAPMDVHSMDELRRYFSQATEKTLQSFQGLSAENLEMIIEINEMEDTGANWISTAIDHEIHHKGQVFTYARIVGVNSLPFFITKP